MGCCFLLPCKTIFGRVVGTIIPKYSKYSKIFQNIPLQILYLKNTQATAGATVASWEPHGWNKWMGESSPQTIGSAAENSWSARFWSPPIVGFYIHSRWLCNPYEHALYWWLITVNYISIYWWLILMLNILLMLNLHFQTYPNKPYPHIYCCFYIHHCVPICLG
jgi:hypothetical protein